MSEATDEDVSRQGMRGLPIDDRDAAVYPIGQIAAMLGVRQAFVWRLDARNVGCFTGEGL